MKQFRRLCALLTAGLAAALLSPLSAFAADAATSVPEIQLRETGAQNEYKITIENWDSAMYSVEFDLSVDIENAACTMQWSDTAASSYRKVETKSGAGKTTFTFYFDRRTPISSSSSAAIGSMTLQTVPKTPVFSTSGYMKLLDEDLKERTFTNVSVHVTTWQPSSGGSGGSGGSSGSNKLLGTQPGVTWSSLANKLKTQNGKTTVTIDMKKDGRLSADILKNLKAKKVFATLDFGSYQWTIDGASIGTIPARQTYYDFTIRTLQKKNLSRAADGTDLFQFETAFDGSLPFTATLVYPAGSSYSGKTLYLSYYNEQEGTLEYRSAAQADTDGKVSFAFDHFSKYVITSTDLWHPAAEDTAPATNGAPSAGTAGAGTAVLVPPENAPEPPAESESDEPSSTPQEITEPTQSASSSQEALAQPEQPKDRSALPPAAALAIIAVIAAAIAVGVVIVIRRKKS